MDRKTRRALSSTGRGALNLNPRMPVAAFEERVDSFLSDDERDADIDTVGGLVSTLAGRVPAKGEAIGHPSGLEFRILEADARGIRRPRRGGRRRGRLKQGAITGVSRRFQWRDPRLRHIYTRRPKD